MKEMHTIARGRVQGVGFRATVKHYAQSLRLRGNVRNLTDGTVEIYAQGSDSDLKELLERLELDEGIGQVEGFITDVYDAPEREWKDFRIIF